MMVPLPALATPPVPKVESRAPFGVVAYYLVPGSTIAGDDNLAIGRLYGDAGGFDDSRGDHARGSEGAVQDAGRGEVRDNEGGRGGVLADHDDIAVCVQGGARGQSERTSNLAVAPKVVSGLPSLL